MGLRPCYLEHFFASYDPHGSYSDPILFTSPAHREVEQMILYNPPANSRCNPPSLFTLYLKIYASETNFTANKDQAIQTNHEITDTGPEITQEEEDKTVHESQTTQANIKEIDAESEMTQVVDEAKPTCPTYQPTKFLLVEPT